MTHRKNPRIPPAADARTARLDPARLHQRKAELLTRDPLFDELRSLRDTNGDEARIKDLRYILAHRYGMAVPGEPIFEGLWAILRRGAVLRHDLVGGYDTDEGM